MVRLLRLAPVSRSDDVRVRETNRSNGIHPLQAGN